MNPYAVPSIIAFALLLMVSLSVLFQNLKETSNRLLAALCLNTALSIGAAAMLHLSTTRAEAVFWNKWPYILGFPSLFWAIEYVLHISGRSRRLEETLLGLRAAVHRRAIYVLVCAAWLIIILTDSIIAPPEYFPTTGWEHGYGSLYPSLMIFNLYLLFFMVMILVRGTKSAASHLERKLIFITLLALVGQFAFLMFIGGVLPFLGHQLHSIAPLANIYMCFLLTYGLLKMQWETITELQEGLEEKVARRTRELKAANERLEQAQVQISRYIDPNITAKIFEGEFSAELSHRRTKLTTFFSDIKDFTKFADASDPEDVARLLNEYLGEMARIVRAHGGTIPQFTGDGVFAIFGAPDSRGDKEDALACVRMAMEMQQRMKVLRERWWNSGLQFAFEIRCGINTGMANVGNYGSEGFMEYLAIGLSTNLASRLEQACTPGEIYLSHSTWALVNEEIPCREVGVIEVKGFHYPIQTYRVVPGGAALPAGPEPVRTVPV